jgi:hypothetical protein
MSRAVYVEKRGVHDKDSHSSDKDKSKFLKLHQIDVPFAPESLLLPNKLLSTFVAI